LNAWLLLLLLAEEVREIMAKLGYRTLDEMIGQTPFGDQQAWPSLQSRGLDLESFVDSLPFESLSWYSYRYFSIMVWIKPRIIFHRKGEGSFVNKTPVIIEAG
jgi:hypothetical protein